MGNTQMERPWISILKHFKVLNDQNLLLGCIISSLFISEFTVIRFVAQIFCSTILLVEFILTSTIFFWNTVLNYTGHEFSKLIFCTEIVLNFGHYCIISKKTSYFILRMWATIIEISQKTFLIAPFCREFSTEFFKA